MLIESKFRLYLVVGFARAVLRCLASITLKALRKRPSRVQTNSELAGRARGGSQMGARTFARLLRTTALPESLTGESGIAAGAAPQRERVCGVWILPRARK